MVWESIRKIYCGRIYERYMSDAPRGVLLICRCEVFNGVLSCFWVVSELSWVSGKCLTILCLVKCSGAGFGPSNIPGPDLDPR